MKKIIHLIILTVLLFHLNDAQAGFGDDTRYDEEETGSDVTPTSTFNFDSEEKFSRDNFSNDQIMDDGDGDDPPPMPEIPLDGGASLLLIGGIGLGIRKLLAKRK